LAYLQKSHDKTIIKLSLLVIKFLAFSRVHAHKLSANNSAFCLVYKRLHALSAAAVSKIFVAKFCPQKYFKTFSAAITEVENLIKQSFYSSLFEEFLTIRLALKIQELSNSTFTFRQTP